MFALLICVVHLLLLLLLQLSLLAAAFIAAAVIFVVVKCPNVCMNLYSSTRCCCCRFLFVAPSFFSTHFLRCFSCIFSSNFSFSGMRAFFRVCYASPVLSRLLLLPSPSLLSNYILHTLSCEYVFFSIFIAFQVCFAMLFTRKRDHYLRQQQTIVAAKLFRKT